MNLKRLLPVYLGAIITPMGGVGIITLLPVLCQNWQIGIQWVSLTITFYIVPYVTFQLFSGSIAQVFGTRPTLLFGFAAYSLGGLLSGLSPNLWALIGARFIQGLGAAFIAPLILALVGELVEAKHLGKAMGIMGAMYTAGITMGPLIAGVLDVSLGWPWFFFFLMAFAVVVGILYWISSGDAKQKAPESAKISDALPLVRKSLSYPEVRFLGLAGFSMFLGYIGLMTFAADFLKVSFSLPSDKIGLMLSMTGFTGVLSAPVAGFLGDRLGRNRVAYLGGTIMIVSVLGLGAGDYSYARYLFFFAVFGVGSATTWTSLNTLAVELVPDLRKPVTSVYSSLKFAGYGAAPLLLSLLYVPFSLSGVRWACIFCFFLGIFLVFRMTVRREERQAEIFHALAEGKPDAPGKEIFPASPR